MRRHEPNHASPNKLISDKPALGHPVNGLVA